jgi:hypothetical protein
MNILCPNRLRSRAHELCPHNPRYPRHPRFVPFFSDFPPTPSKFLRFSAIFREPKKYFPTSGGSFSTIRVAMGVPSKKQKRPSFRINNLHREENSEKCIPTHKVSSCISATKSGGGAPNRKLRGANPSSRGIVAKTSSHPRLSLVRHQLSLFELRSRRRFGSRWRSRPLACLCGLFLVGSSRNKTRAASVFHVRRGPYWLNRVLQNACDSWMNGRFA